MADVRSPAGARTRQRLGELLVQAGLLSEAQINEALAAVRTLDGRRERLGQAIVRLGFASERDVGRTLAWQLDLEYLDAAALPIDEEVTGRIPSALAERHGLLPLRLDADGTLVVACADPTNIVALDDVRLRSGVRRVRPVVVSATVVEAAIGRAYGFEQRAGDLIEALDAGRAEEAGEALAAETSVADGPIIRLADGIIAEALSTRASDVHVEPGPGDAAVRYRVDGVLRQVMAVPRAATGPLTSRFKLLAGMDIAERRRPQDGRTRLRTATADVDLRMSTMPSLHGETIVIRLLRKGAERLSIDDVGFTDQQRAAILGAVEQPQGLILLTGPTGAGKTSTLYGLLGLLADERRNIITVEDPVEYELPGVNQTQVNEKIGLTFARSLRTVLRQDPDVVMVGEIRDPETAELALQASLTGHLVLSTLHTNDAPGAIVRLRDLGVPPYLIASSLSMVIAQRLARRVCQACQRPVAPTDRQVALLRLAPAAEIGAAFRAGDGCDACNGAGYHGRTGIFEVLAVDGRVRELVTGNAAEATIRHAARAGGMRSLREDGLAKAAAGSTTLDEVARVCPTDVADDGACPSCAEAIEPDFAVCPWCGAALRPDACARCDRTLEPGWRRCPSCATPTPLAAEQAASPA